jgi:aspartyl-tRNA(Asn)/glutamyl-tRNA(Gln) amidotransferase subunit C
MSLTLNDVNRIAQLARLELSAEEAQATLGQLNGIFALIEQMRGVDTSNVEPLSSPLQTRGLSLRLREDQVTEGDRRSDYQAVAPAVADGLYLVPRVIE